MRRKVLSTFICVIIITSVSASIAQNVGQSNPSPTSGGSSGLADSPWPMFRQNLNHTGVSPYDTSGNNGQLKWSFATNLDIDSSPVIDSSGTIYIGSRDRNLYAINPDGTEKWSFKTNGMVFSSPAIGPDNTIYIGSDDFKLYAINSNGSEKWNFTTGERIKSPSTIGADGTIYFGSYDNNLYAINPDGTQKWSFKTGGRIWSSPAINSDGTIYFGSEDNKLYAINQDGIEKWNFMTGGDIRSSPAISSEGSIYIGSDDNKLYAINTDGTEKWSFITTNDVHSSPAIGTNGMIYVGSTDGNLYAINPDGTENWRFITDWGVFSSPAIGSDGLIYVGSQDTKLYAINPDGTEKWNYTTDSRVEPSPAIGSDGTIYVGCHDGKLYAIGTLLPNIIVEKTANVTVAKPGDLIEYTIYYNNTLGNTTNDYNKTHQQLTFEDALQYDPSFSSDGNKVVYRSREDGGGYFDIWIMDANGANHQQLTFENAGQSQPCFNPNGSKVVYQSWESGSTYTDIWIMDADGSNHQQLTSEYVYQRSPTFSPDGNKIAYTSKEDGGSYWDIWIMDTDGGNRQQLTFENVDQYWPCFSPYGNRILYSSYEDGGGYTDIWIMDANGNNHHQLTFENYDQNRPSFNPDGTKIIYESLEDGGSYNDLWIMNPDGSEHIQLTFEDKTQTEAQFNPNGYQIVYTSNEDGGNYVDIWSLNFATQNGTAGKVWINDTLPSEVTFVTSSAEANRIGDYNWTFYEVGPGEHNFTITVQVNNGVPNGTILTNFVHLDYIDYNGIPMPDSWDSVDVLVLAPEYKPPVADAGPDPTVNEGDVVQFNGSGSSGGRGGFINAVALWHMNEGSGSIIHDETANHNEGTIIGANWVDGKFGKALYFDGLNDFVEILDSASLDITDKITIEAWIKPVITGPGSTTYMYVVCKEIHPGYPTKGVAYTLDIYPGKARSGGHMDFGGVLRPFKVVGSTDIVDNIWQYIAITWNGTVAKIFYNGQLEGAINLTGNIASTDANVGIGRYGRVFFHGVIDEVVIYNRAISDNEIFDYYNRGKEHYVGSSGDPTEIVSYEWDFDSSNGLWWDTGAVPDATGPTPTHVYGDGGDYTVTLRVTDDANETDTDECIVTVNNVAPAITLMMTYPDDEGSRVTFEAEATDPGSDDVTYSWELEYGPTIENTFYNNGVSPEPVYDPASNEVKSPSGTYPFHTSDVATHIYGDNYDYTIILTVTDDDGGESTATTTVTVDNFAPSILEINIPSDIDEGSQGSFETHTTDQGSDDLTFTWDFELGPTITNVHYNDGVGLDTYPSPWGDYPLEVWDSVNHAYGDDGVYILTLSIEDDDGGITTYSTDIPVLNVAPTIDVVTAPGGDEGAVLTFSSTVTDPGSDDLTFTWTWGDGSSDTMNVHYNDGVGLDPPRSPLGAYPFTTTDTVTHIYGDDGNYTITLTVEDDDGGLTTHTTTVTIDNVVPTIDPFGPFTVDEGSSLELTTTSTDPGSEDLTFTWEFDMGPIITNVYYNDGIATDPYPSPWGTYPYSASDSVEHTYGDNGVYPVILTVSDDDGGMTSYTTNITVNNVAPTIATIESYMYVNFSLRVAGEKYHSVGIHLYEDDVEIWNAQVTRQPGSPDEQAATLSGYSINLGSSYRAVVDYLPNDPRVNGNVWGGNPVWIIMEFQDGTTERLHHTFNVRQSYWDSDHWNHIDPWEVDLTGIIYRHNITFKATASDPGSDDLIFVWDFGDGGTVGPNTYLNNGINPDPYPSPEINPMNTSDTVLYAYAASGIYTVTLTVMDDDGGTTTTALVIVLPG